MGNKPYLIITGWTHLQELGSIYRAWENFVNDLDEKIDINDELSKYDMLLTKGLTSFNWPLLFYTEEGYNKFILTYA